MGQSLMRNMNSAWLGAGLLLVLWANSAATDSGANMIQGRITVHPELARHVAPGELIGRTPKAVPLDTSGVVLELNAERQ